MKIDSGSSDFGPKDLPQEKVIWDLAQRRNPTFGSFNVIEKIFEYESVEQCFSVFQRERCLVGRFFVEEN